MGLLTHAQVAVRQLRSVAVRRVLSHRIQVRHPTLRCHPTVIWDYGYHDIDAIHIGEHVAVMAWSEVIVYKRSPYSPFEGRLVLGDRSIISLGVNLRAAGGAIEIGAKTAIGQYSVVIAANHAIKPGVDRFNTPYDDSRTGVFVGRNVWVGAHCVLLPGVTVGDNAVIAAGAVVNCAVPADELWGGVPARRIKSLLPDATRA
jgi:acetyltransferase-like isoleucine patch superfamily enzyme